MPPSFVRKMAIMPKQYPSEVRDRAVRMTLDRLSDYPSVFAACKAMEGLQPSIGSVGDAYDNLASGLVAHVVKPPRPPKAKERHYNLGLASMHAPAICLQLPQPYGLERRNNKGLTTYLKTLRETEGNTCDRALAA
jgi:hypothetical protein